MNRAAKPSSRAISRPSSRIDWLVREHWIVEGALTSLRADSRKLLRAHASLDRLRAIALALRTTLQLKDELEKQLAESHCTVPFGCPL
jgi:hypothetical protein